LSAGRWAAQRDTLHESKHPNHPSYQDVINEHAKQGWRFAQLLIECPAAVPIEYVLVFEQPTEEL
jgi:hypothetical protein